MNRRTILRGLLVAPIAAAAAPFLPRVDIAAAFARIAEAARRAAAGMLTANIKLRDEFTPALKAVTSAVYRRKWITTIDLQPPKHPMCRCTLLPEGSFATIHETAEPIAVLAPDEFRERLGLPALERADELHRSERLAPWDQTALGPRDGERSDQYLERITEAFRDLINEVDDG